MELQYQNYGPVNQGLPKSFSHSELGETQQVSVPTIEPVKTLFNSALQPSKPWLMAKYGFSNRESEVVQTLITGKTNLKIADALFVCEQTIKFHLTSIYKKAGVSNRLELFSKILEETSK